MTIHEIAALYGFTMRRCGYDRARALALVEDLTDGIERVGPPPNREVLARLLADVDNDLRPAPKCEPYGPTRAEVDAERAWNERRRREEEAKIKPAPIDLVSDEAKTAAPSAPRSRRRAAA